MQQLQERPDNPRQPRTPKLTPEEGYGASDFQPFLPMTDKERRDLERTENPPWSEPVVAKEDVREAGSYIMAFLFFLFAALCFLVVAAMIFQWFIFHV